jgi:hypothetical protein
MEITYKVFSSVIAISTTTPIARRHSYKLKLGSHGPICLSSTLLPSKAKLSPGDQLAVSEILKLIVF